MAAERKTYMVSMKVKDHLYLRENGINKSKFIRQAIEAHRNKDWKFDYLKE